MNLHPPEVYGGGVAGVLTALGLFYRLGTVNGWRYPLDISAILIAGVLIISLIVGMGVYASLGGVPPKDQPELPDDVEEGGD